MKFQKYEVRYCPITGRYLTFLHIRNAMMHCGFYKYSTFFDDHTIGGLDKMTVMITLADIISLAMALVHIARGQTNYDSIFNS